MVIISQNVKRLEMPQLKMAESNCNMTADILVS
jgi:hypothetical protein